MTTQHEENTTSHVISYFSSIKLSKMKSTDTPCKNTLGRQRAVSRITLALQIHQNLLES